MRALATLVLAAAFAAGQGPAPDFQVDALNLGPQSLTALLRVHGPPAAPFQVLITLDDPFSTPPEQIIIYPFLSGQTDGAGNFSLLVPVAGWQGPLPDVWFGAVVATPAGPAVPEVVSFSGVLGCPGCGNPLAQHSNAFLYDRFHQRLHVRVSGSDGPYTVWEVPCPPPALGAPWTPGATAGFLGATATSGGNSAWNGAVPVPPPGQGKCIIVRSNGVGGVVIAAKTIRG